MNFSSYESVVGTVIRLRAGRSRVRIPTGAGDFSVLQNIHKTSGAHPTFYSVVIGALSLGGGAKAARGVKLTTYFHRVSSLRMGGAVRTPPCICSGRVRGRTPLVLFEFQPSNDPACAETFAQTCKFHARNGYGLNFANTCYNS
jgi:hypothetical protein